MQDTDLIEVAYILREALAGQSVAALFQQIRSHSCLSEDDIRIARYDSNAQKDWFYDDFESAMAYCKRHKNEHCSVKIPFREFEMTVGINDDEPLLSETVNVTFRTRIHPFKNRSERNEKTLQERRRSFIRILASAASVIEPFWGFGRRCGLAVGDDETVEELADRIKPPLYEYNVFREETVGAIGRDRVLSAPAYYVKELDSGGVFMAVTEPPRQWGHDDQPYEEVADHLGLPPMTPERYH